jgi:hypothetical protein
MTTNPKKTTDRKPYGSQWRRKETPMRFTDRDGDILEAVAVNRVLDRGHSPIYSILYAKE